MEIPDRCSISSIGARLSLLIWLMVSGLSTAQAQNGNAVNPHGNLTINVSCEDCHTTDAFVPARKEMNFDHDTQTEFPLLGRHMDLSCQSCHLDLKFTEPQIGAESCVSCHVDVHQGQFAQSCESCHNQMQFEQIDGRFVHSQTSFPLTGAHMQISCESCHTDQTHGAFTTLESECYDCHDTDYEQAETIDHVASGFPTQCEQCHTTQAWAPAFFDHITESGGFALLGAHSQIDCASCHIVPSMETIFPATSDQDCYTCHESDYQHEHGGSGFPTTCQVCHNVNSWEGADFDHAAASGGFELLGAHSRTDCESCHVVPSYDTKFAVSSNEDCYGCHEADYQREHGSSGFPTTCQDCHNVDTWDDAEFDHVAVSGGFELLGSHNTLECASCHNLPSYDLKFTASGDQDCYGCHEADYQNEHAGSGFPTDCTVCHDTDNWEGGDFEDHDNQYFPIYSGEHRGIWSDCQTCHTDPSNYQTFSCIDCHEHNQSSMDSEHDDVGGYVYQSTSCYSCHPDGRAEDD
jgi:hypothetical protein